MELQAALAWEDARQAGVRGLVHWGSAVPSEQFVHVAEGMYGVLSKGSRGLLCNWFLLKRFQHSLPRLQPLSLCL